MVQYQVIILILREKVRMFEFLTIVIGSILYALFHWGMGKVVEENVDMGCLGTLVYVLFMKFVPPVIFVGAIIGIIIYHHDSQIP